MTISELICLLQEIQRKHGDLPVYHATDNLMLRPPCVQHDITEFGEPYAVLLRPACPKLMAVEYPQPYLNRQKGDQK